MLDKSCICHVVSFLFVGISNYTKIGLKLFLTGLLKVRCFPVAILLSSIFACAWPLHIKACFFEAASSCLLATAAIQQTRAISWQQPESVNKHQMLHKAVSLWQPPAASCQLWQLPATSCQLQEVACYHMSAYGSSLLPAASLASGSCPCCQLSAIKF